MKIINYETLRSAIKATMSNFIESKEMFSAHDITEQLRALVNGKMIYIKDVDNGLGRCTIDHNSVKVIVTQLATSELTSSLSSKFNGTFIEYTPSSSNDNDTTNIDQIKDQIIDALIDRDQNVGKVCIMIEAPNSLNDAFLFSNNEGVCYFDSSIDVECQLKDFISDEIRKINLTNPNYDQGDINQNATILVITDKIVDSLKQDGIIKIQKIESSNDTILDIDDDEEEDDLSETVDVVLLASGQ
jgi:hypothetical protein